MVVFYYRQLLCYFVTVCMAGIEKKTNMATESFQSKRARNEYTSCRLTLSAIPSAVLAHIVSFSCVSDFVSVMSVSRAWCTIAKLPQSSPVTIEFTVARNIDKDYTSLWKLRPSNFVLIDLASVTPYTIINALCAREIRKSVLSLTVLMSLASLTTMTAPMTSHILDLSSLCVLRSLDFCFLNKERTGRPCELQLPSTLITLKLCSLSVGQSKKLPHSLTHLEFKEFDSNTHCVEQWTDIAALPRLTTLHTDMGLSSSQAYILFEQSNVLQSIRFGRNNYGQPGSIRTVNPITQWSRTTKALAALLLVECRFSLLEIEYRVDFWQCLASITSLTTLRLDGLLLDYDLTSSTPKAMETIASRLTSLSLCGLAAPPTCDYFILQLCQHASRLQILQIGMQNVDLRTEQLVSLSMLTNLTSLELVGVNNSLIPPPLPNLKSLAWLNTSLIFNTATCNRVRLPINLPALYPNLTELEMEHSEFNIDILKRLSHLQVLIGVCARKKTKIAARLPRIKFDVKVRPMY
jgi:hypothetical protein